MAAALSSAAFSAARMPTPAVARVSCVRLVAPVRARAPASGTALVARVSSRSPLRPSHALGAVLSPPASAPVEDVEEEEEEYEEELDDEEDNAGLTPPQVEALLSTMCEGTDIAQLEIKMGSFKLYVRRSLEDKTTSVAAVAPAAAAPAAAAPAAAAPAASVAAPASAASTAATADAAEADESAFVPVQTTKVGVLRRGRYVKGRRIGKGVLVKAGETVKKGQVLAYIDQLGALHPVHAPQSGQIERVLVEDGDAVGYLQSFALMTPFFGA